MVSILSHPRRMYVESLYMVLMKYENIFMVGNMFLRNGWLIYCLTYNTNISVGNSVHTVYVSPFQYLKLLSNNNIHFFKLSKFLVGQLYMSRAHVTRGCVKNTHPHAYIYSLYIRHLNTTMSDLQEQRTTHTPKMGCTTVYSRCEYFRKSRS